MAHAYRGERSAVDINLPGIVAGDEVAAGQRLTASGLECSWVIRAVPAVQSADVVLFRPAAALSFDLSFDIASLAHCDATSESGIHPISTCKALILNGGIVQLAFLPDADASLAQEILEIADR